MTFQSRACQIVRASYGNMGRIAPLLYDVEDGSPVAVATVHMPELTLAADEVVIKDYSENEGMLNLLVAEGIVSAPLRAVPSGYVTLFVCRCLPPPSRSAGLRRGKPRPLGRGSSLHGA